MGRMIDADKVIKGMQYYHDDCARTSVYTKLGFETAMEVVKSTPTVEAIPKADYEARLRDDMVAMLEDLKLDIEYCVDAGEAIQPFEDGVNTTKNQVLSMVDERINALKGEENGKDN